MKLRKLSECNLGFTIIEVVVVIAVLMLLAGLGLWTSLDFYRTYALNSEQSMAVSLLSMARARAMNNVNQSPHGLFITSTEYVLFQGSSYALRNVWYDEKTPIAYVVSLSGIQEVVFAPLTGEVITTGDIVLSERRKSVTITINNEGRIAW